MSVRLMTLELETFLNPRVPCPLPGLKPVKIQSSATSIVSFDPAPAVSKPLMSPANSPGLCSASSPPLPVK